jgi:hypothetical protein
LFYQVRFDYVCIYLIFIFFKKISTNKSIVKIEYVTESNFNKIIFFYCAIVIVWLWHCFLIEFEKKSGLLILVSSPSLLDMFMMRLHFCDFTSDMFSFCCLAIYCHIIFFFSVVDREIRCHWIVLEMITCLKLLPCGKSFLNYIVVIVVGSFE